MNYAYNSFELHSRTYRDDFQHHLDYINKNGYTIISIFTDGHTCYVVFDETPDSQARVQAKRRDE